MAAMPTSVPTARSKTPADSGMVTAIATSAVRADWSTSECHTPEVRNVFGTQNENNRNRNTKM